MEGSKKGYGSLELEENVGFGEWSLEFKENVGFGEG